MGPIEYTIFTYALTVVISFAIVGIIVLINRIMSKNIKDSEEKDEKEEK